MEILTKCLPWYKCSSTMDVTWVSETIADIADWCDMKENDKEDERVNAIIDRASWAAMAGDAKKVRTSSISLYVNRILRISQRIIKQTQSLHAI